MPRICHCNSCGQKTLLDLIDLGKQPVCHHFLRNSREEESAHRMVLGQCTTCATVQLTERIPVEELTPRYDWLTCTEPEAHLDDLVKTVSRLPGITKNSRIGGLSFKDDTTLKRFSNLGFVNTWRVDPGAELGIDDPNCGIETIQVQWNEKNVGDLIERHGLSDIFIARHILEHAYDMRSFAELCKKLTKPGGYVIFEIPDCQRAFEKFDYTTIWDQHTVYFTEKTFQNFFNHNGLSLVYFKKMSYSIEDSYVGIARSDETCRNIQLPDDVLEQELARAKRFADEYPATKSKFKKFLAGCQEKGEKAALFGGGHMSCTFLNIFDLKNDFEFVVDDNPNMRGLFMPGSRLPVFESKAMYEQDIKVCLLTLSASSEEKVVGNNQRFLDNGGTFFSIFPGSQWAMEV
jgi:hypothetical protein